MLGNLIQAYVGRFRSCQHRCRSVSRSRRSLCALLLLAGELVEKVRDELVGHDAAPSVRRALRAIVLASRSGKPAACGGADHKVDHVIAAELPVANVLR